MNYAKYVHEYTRDNGETIYIVAVWVDHAGQWQCPMDKRTAHLTGCHTYFSRSLAGIGGEGYKTRRQALRRARYLFGE